MRVALLLLPLAFLDAACTVHQFAEGTVSYTSTPLAQEHSGALPLSSLVCINERQQVGVRLGECQLTGYYRPHHGRGSAGGAAAIASAGACVLPTREGRLPLTVENATFEDDGNAVNVTVGGATGDGRYVTYRFTGFLGEEAPKPECEAILGKW